MMVSSKLRRKVGYFRADRSGQVTFLLGLMIVPILCAVGAGLDYGRQRAAKVRLDAALDSAILAVASRKSNSFDQAEVQATLDTQFRGQFSSDPNVKISGGDAGFKVTVTNAVNGVTISARYAATVPTTLTRLMKFDGMALTGTASAARDYARYMDFYLLLDNSPSMGLAASQADINRMITLTANQSTGNSSRGIPNRRSCAFACHETPRSGAAEDFSDNYWLAKNRGVRLRIDNLRDAAASLIDKAERTETLDDQFRMGIYTFNDRLTQVTPLTTSYSAAKTSALGIDLVRSYSDLSDMQTSYIRALPQMSGLIPDSGTGITSGSPIKFLFFVTDGVQDAPIDNHAIIPAYEKVTSNRSRFIGAIDPSLCTDMKNRGIRIGIIYTKYLPLPMDGWYNTYVAPFLTTTTRVSDNLSSCASPGLFSEVSVDGDVTAALNKLFIAAVNSVRLTN